ncbi:hypothetical protein EON65_28795 [archaeon]|nr:MAG: hypothetical protein EON65_28795 [archaeon]
MKRDVTMNGVRTKSGVLQDAMSYLQRYYINNYRDKANQQDLNIILGVEGEVEDELVEDLATVPTAETKVSEESNTGEEDTDEEDKEDEEEDAYDDIDSVEVSDKKFSAVIADTGSEDASDSDTDISTAESSNADEVEDESPKSRFGRMLNSFFSSLQTDLHDALENAAQSDI